MHPVGQHFDVFADKKASLENRVCFFIDESCIVSLGLPMHLRYGRGGGGINRFCYALLDWRTSSHKKRRDIWIDVRYKDLKYSSYWYANHGAINKRFTQLVWKNFRKSFMIVNN